MSGPGKPPGRSRPTNNQLLYKAHFRWKHYTNPLPLGKELVAGTEACASVTSAFLQVLATIADVEASRTDKARNVLHILSTNTRRTKVVELSSGTHRVADELRRHSLSDGQGGQYSTNLDRNRYGSDNNYLFTVTRFNLECLGLCPCLVDIEIMDTRNGNEVQLVTAGQGACSCDSPARKERADASCVADSHARAGSPARRSPSVGGGGLRRVSSASALRRAPSVNREASRTSAGSELFDALLTAATGGGNADAERGGHGGQAVTSRARNVGMTPPSAPPLGAGGTTANGLHRQRSRLLWNTSFNEVDSLQNAIDVFRSGGGYTTMNNLSGDEGRPARPRGMLRRNSVSMIVENPVLAQTGAGDSMLLGGFPPPVYGALAPQGEPARSVRSAEGDTEGHRDADGAADTAAGGVHNNGGLVESLSRRGSMPRHWAAASAVNLSRLAAGPADLRRLGDELRATQADLAAAENLCEELRVREAVARDVAASAEKSAAVSQHDLRASRAILRVLRTRLAATGVDVSGEEGTMDDHREEAGENRGASPKSSSSPGQLHEAERGSSPGIKLLDEDSKTGVFPSQQQLLLARLARYEAELSAAHAALDDAHASLRRVTAERGALEARLRSALMVHPPPHPAAPLFRTGSLTSAHGTPQAGHRPADSGGLSPPLFGMAPLNPYGGMNAAAFRPPLSQRTLQKVASMPAIHGSGTQDDDDDRDRLIPGIKRRSRVSDLPHVSSSSWAANLQQQHGNKRARENSPIPEASVEESSPPRKRLLELQEKMGSTRGPEALDEMMSPEVAREEASSPYDRPPSAGITGEAPTPPPCVPYA